MSQDQAVEDVTQIFAHVIRPITVSDPTKRKGWHTYNPTRQLDPGIYALEEAGDSYRIAGTSEIFGRSVLNLKGMDKAVELYESDEAARTAQANHKPWTPIQIHYPPGFGERYYK